MATQTLNGSIHPVQLTPAELPPGALSLPGNPAKLGFKTTDELPDLQDVIGQPRALRALELGSEVGGTDYNIFVLGLPGSGRTTASLTFEQSYSEVEGDSASAAELMALLSAIADIPLRQDRAITGSINQHGQIQAIGGVNEKIEGFFSICKAKGLSGEQGVVIPTANQRSLMLCKEVIAAVAAGQFHIWPVNGIDQCVAILTGCEPGERDADGRYPQGSFNQAVTARLKTFASLVASHKQDGKPDMYTEKDEPD